MIAHNSQILHAGHFWEVKAFLRLQQIECHGSAYHRAGVVQPMSGKCTLRLASRVLHARSARIYTLTSDDIAYTYTTDQQ